MSHTINCRNAVAALQAAIDSINILDRSSAIEYLTVAALELVGGKPGQAILYATDDASECVKAGVIDRWQSEPS